MDEQHLTIQLQAIRLETKEIAAEPKERLTLYDKELQDIATRLSELQAQQQEIKQEFRAAQDELHQLLTESEEREWICVLSAMSQSCQSIQDMKGYWLKRERLGQELEVLTSSNPDLKQDLDDFRQFEANPAELLGSLPSSYRASVLRLHEEKKERLQPYLKVQHQIRELRYGHPVVIQVLTYREPDSEIIHWVTPIPKPAKEDGEESEIIYGYLTELVLKSFASFNVLPDWYVAEIESDKQWAGYVALSTLLEFSGSGDLWKSAEEEICRLLSTAREFQGVQLIVRITEISDPLWRRGQHTVLPSAPHGSHFENETIADGEPIPSVPLAELTNGLYRDEDLVSWMRPLKVTADSNWSLNGRRLRTLLIRLVARGVVEGEHISPKLLWQNLPAPHYESMRKSIEQLIEKQLLLLTAEDGESEPHISLNVQKMNEVENLINRDVTNFWLDLMDEPGG
jgi:hypothetical protein